MTKPDPADFVTAAPTRYANVFAKPAEDHEQQGLADNLASVAYRWVPLAFCISVPLTGETKISTGTLRRTCEGERLQMK